MSDFRNYLNEQLQRPSFKAEWDALQPELTIAQAMIDARKESGLTQKQLSERTGIAQADISKLERGNANPSLRTLQRLAAGMGMNVKIEFVTNITFFRQYISPERPQTLRAYSFIYTKIRPDHLAVSGALKTDAVFSLRQDSCKAGLMPQAEQGICTQTLCS